MVMSSGMNGTKSRGIFASVAEMQAANLRVGTSVWVHGGSRYDIYSTDQGGSVQLSNGLWAKPLQGESGGGIGEANTTSNTGAGEGLALPKSGVNLPFKSLKVSGDATITSDENSVTIDVQGGGGAGGDMYKATYDPQGVNSDAFDMSNMVESNTAKILTQTEREAISANSSKRSYPQADQNKLATIEDGAQVNLINALNAGTNVTITDLGGGVFQIASTGSGGGAIKAVHHLVVNLKGDTLSETMTIPAVNMSKTFLVLNTSLGAYDNVYASLTTSTEVFIRRTGDAALIKKEIGYVAVEVVEYA